MKVAITGGTGHVGANLVRAMLARGWSVRALIHDDGRALEGLPVEKVPGEVGDPDALRYLFEGAELVFHLAARIALTRRDSDGTRRVNIEGPRNVAQACLAARVRRLVHFSSIHAFDDRVGVGPIDEERGPMVDPARPLYGLTKAAGEKAVLEAVGQGLDAVIVNPCGVLGPHDYKGSAMGRVLAQLAAGRLPFVPASGFTWVDARDVAEGAIAAAERGQKGRRYLLAGTWASIRQLGDLVDQATGLGRTRVTVPTWTAWAGVPFAALGSLLTGNPPGCTPDSLRVLQAETRATPARAASELGFSARPLAETVVDTLAWQRAYSSQPILAAWHHSREAVS